MPVYTPNVPAKGFAAAVRAIADRWLLEINANKVVAPVILLEKLRGESVCMVAGLPTSAAPVVLYFVLIAYWAESSK